MLFRVDNQVKAGTPFFFDKYSPNVFFTSPVSDRVVAVNRGERRRILEIVIRAGDKMEYEEFDKSDPELLDREGIV